jgi:hypothetical protein
MSINSQLPNRAAAVTPGTTEQFGHALFCGGAGTVTLITTGGDTVVFTVQAGQILPIMFTKVTAATATLLVRMWKQ